MQIILAFFLIMLNMIAGILPATFLILLFLYDGIQISHLESFIFVMKVLLCCTSFALCLYIILDALLGFAVFSKTKKLQEYQHSMRYGKICQKPFDEIKEIFKIPETQLLISPNAQEKTCTVSSIGKSCICITTGTLYSMRIKTQSDEEFQEVIKAVLARQFVIIATGDTIIQKMFEMNALIVRIAKSTNTIFFKFCGKILSIIPVIGITLQKICHTANKSIVAFLEVINVSLMIVYKVFTSIAAGRDECYYDAAASEIVGGASVAKALSFTEKPDDKFFSTSTNIHKRIKKIAGIEKKEKFSFDGSFQKTILFISIIALICLLFFLAYQIKIWRIFHFGEYFLSSVQENINF